MQRQCYYSPALIITLNSHWCSAVFSSICTEEFSSSQQTFNCSKSTTKTLEKSVRHV